MARNIDRFSYILEGLERPATSFHSNVQTHFRAHPPAPVRFGGDVLFRLDYLSCDGPPPPCERFRAPLVISAPWELILSNCPAELTSRASASMARETQDLLPQR
jgi:hypothetical protein